MSRFEQAVDGTGRPPQNAISKINKMTKLSWHYPLHHTYTITTANKAGYSFDSKHYRTEFDSSTSQPDVCHYAWLYTHSWITCPKDKPSTLMSKVHVTCESKLRSVVRVIHAPMPTKNGGNRAYSRVLCPGSCQLI